MAMDRRMYLAVYLGIGRTPERNYMYVISSREADKMHRDI